MASQAEEKASRTRRVLAGKGSRRTPEKLFLPHIFSASVSPSSPRNKQFDIGPFFSSSKGFQSTEPAELHGLLGVMLPSK